MTLIWSRMSRELPATIFFDAKLVKVILFTVHHFETKESRNPNHIWHVKFHRSRDFSGNQNHLKDKVYPEKQRITKRRWSFDKSVLWASRGRVMPRGKRLGPGNAAKPTWTTCYCGMVAECRQNPWDHGTFRSLPFPCLSCTPRDRSLLLVLPKRETPRLVMALRHHESSLNSIDTEDIPITIEIME